MSTFLLWGRRSGHLSTFLLFFFNLSLRDFAGFYFTKFFTVVKMFVIYLFRAGKHTWRLEESSCKFSVSVSFSQTCFTTKNRLEIYSVNLLDVLWQIRKGMWHVGQYVEVVNQYYCLSVTVLVGSNNKYSKTLSCLHQSRKVKLTWLCHKLRLVN